MKQNLSNSTIKQLLAFQKNEITEYHIYNKLAEIEKDPNNQQLLRKIAQEELKHYEIWKSYTGSEIQPDKKQIFKYYWLSKILGLTFGVKLMEKGEKKAQDTYATIVTEIPEAETILQEENQHEYEILELINEEKLEYVGSMVLGLNDALVELTGALAGFTFALQNTTLIALTGLITGISASFSMAASEYLSNKADSPEDKQQHALKSAVYTGIAYIFTVIFLVLPYFIFSNYYTSLGFTLFTAVLIIFLFNFYISIAKDYNFKKRFFEMTFISLGVAGISFVIGILIRNTLGVDI